MLLGSEAFQKFAGVKFHTVIRRQALAKQFFVPTFAGMPSFHKDKGIMAKSHTEADFILLRGWPGGGMISVRPDGSGLDVTKP